MDETAITLCKENDIPGERRGAPAVNPDGAAGRGCWRVVAGAPRHRLAGPSRARRHATAHLPGPQPAPSPHLTSILTKPLQTRSFCLLQWWCST